MPLKSWALVAIVLCLCIGRAARAGNVITTDSVGSTTISCLANSDTYVGIPFTRLPEFNGTINAISSNPANTLTVNGTPGWLPNQFVYAAGSQSKHYYVLLGDGVKEGHIFAVTANGSNTLTVSSTTEDLSGVTAGTQLTIIPYWTPAALFPVSDAGVSFTATGSPPTYQTLLRIPNYSAPGINQPYLAEYYFSNGAWRLVADGLSNPPDRGDDPLLPNGYFVVRNANGAPSRPLRSLGSVLMKRIAVPLVAAPASKQDNAVTMIRPVGVSLDATGLAPIDNSFVQNDQLLLFNNRQAQFNKRPYRTYTYNDGWRLGSDAVTDHGKDVIPAGSALIVRKTAGPASSIFWINSPTYVTATTLLPLQAASRKSHAGVGTFDINLPIVGPKGIEPRSGGTVGDHQIIFTFANNVSLTGASVTPGQNGAAGLAGPPIVNGKRITLSLTGVTNAQVLTVNLTGVSDGSVSSDVAIPVGILAGDTNEDQRVNAKDVNRTKAASGHVLNRTNFTTDVNVDGQINVDDINFVKSFVGTSLP